MGTRSDGYSDEIANDHEHPANKHGEHRYLHSLAHHMSHRGYAGAPHVRTAAKHVADAHEDSGRPTKESIADVDRHVEKHGLKKVLRHHAECHPPGSATHKLLHAAAGSVRESTMSDHRKSLTESARAMTRARVTVLPDAATIEEAEVLHFHHRGAAVGTVHQWKDGRYRKTSTGWQQIDAPRQATDHAAKPEPTSHAAAAPSKAEVPDAQHPPAPAKAPAADAATHHAPKPEPVPASKPASPVRKAKVHAGTPYPAPEGVNPVRGPYDGGGAMTKHAEWARAIKPGHEVEARWLGGNGLGGHRARGVVTKVNANSVRVRLSHAAGMDVYGSGMHGYHRGKEVNVPLFTGNSMAAMARHGHNNGAFPVSDDTPDADHSTHTHAVFVTPKHGIDAGKKRLRQTYPSKEAADAVAAKANDKASKYSGDTFHVEELPEPVTSPDVPLSDHQMVHSVFRNDGLEHERFGTEHAAREKVRSMNDYHARAGLRFHYRRLDQPGLPRQGGAQVQAAADAKAQAASDAHREQQAATRAAHQAQADAVAAQAKIGGQQKDKDVAAPAKQGSDLAAKLGLPDLPPVSARYRAQDLLRMGRPAHPDDDYLQHPEHVGIQVAPKPDDVPQDLHDKVVEFAQLLRADHAAEMKSRGMTNKVHFAGGSQSGGVHVHYKRGNAYVDLNGSGRYMIPTVPGKGRSASFPVGTVRAIRAYGQAHPFYTAGNVLDGSAHERLRKAYVNKVQHGFAFKE